MKFAETLFPKGSFKGQQTDGAYIDKTLAINLDIYAKKIVDDMHFMGIITGSDGVGNGKSTLAQQVGTYLTCKINELHGTKNTFTHRNVFLNSKDLTVKSPSLPRYSVITLDEGDDLTTHGMKELAVRLKRYFRKCRQLNQIIILILPSFFELPKLYAMSRSHFLINVSFENEYERGFFKFYGPLSKKLLYLKGKKEWDYSAHPKDFEGRFFSSYCFFPDLEHEIELYKKNKYQDMVDDNKEKEESKTPATIKKEVTIELFKQMYQNLDGITIKKLSHAFGVHENTGSRWINEEKDEETLEESTITNYPQHNINNLDRKEDDNDEGELDTDYNNYANIQQKSESKPNET